MRAASSCVLHHRVLTLLVLLATIALTVELFIKTPKGFFPQDDTGLIFGGTRASPDISFQAMVELQQQATDIVLADPAVAGVGSSVGASCWNASVNRGPAVHQPQAAGAARAASARGMSINRLRPKLAATSPACGSSCSRRRTCAPAAGRANSSYQFTLWSPDFDELLRLGAPRDRRRSKRPARTRRCRRPTASRTACRPTS